LSSDLLVTKPGLRLTILRPQRGWAALRLRDLWLYRELVYFLTWRDIKVRYKQAFLGVAWAVIQPVVTMVIFTIIFGNLANMAEDGTPYALSSLAAILPWTLFSNGLSKSSASLVGSANLLTKVYFPRLAIPLAAVVAGLIDFAVSFLILLGMMVYFGYLPTARMVWLPLLVLLTLLAALAAGLWLSALNVQYRDVQHMIPFLVTIWMYASPVVYSSAYILERLGPWGSLYSLNPMAGVIDGFRWVVLGGDLPVQALAVSSVVVLVVLVSGLFYFRRMERTFADMV
jgi:lipopolysaccharide transport system permease protein